jgi:hypothetical protein
MDGTTIRCMGGAQLTLSIDTSIIKLEGILKKSIGFGYAMMWE